jgi:hypothetical protein
VKYFTVDSAVWPVAENTAMAESANVSASARRETLILVGEVRYLIGPNLRKVSRTGDTMD